MTEKKPIITKTMVPKVKIKRIEGQTINPGLFYQQKGISPSSWRKLREGKTIEVPEDFLEDDRVHGVEKIE